MRRALTLAVLALALPLALPAPARADEAEAEEHGEHEPGWEGRAQFHVFVPLISRGEAKANDLEAELDRDGFDSLGWGGRVELRSPWRLGGVVDAFYATREVEAQGTLLLPETGTRVEADAISFRRLSVDVLATFLITRLELARVVELEVGAAAGVAWVRYQTQLDAYLNGSAVTFSERHDAAELVLGLDLELSFLGKLLAVVVQGDLGGFGIGDASDLTWKFVAALRVRPIDLISVEVGYRGLLVEYESPGEQLGIETNTHGLFLGASLHF